MKIKTDLLNIKWLFFLLIACNQIENSETLNKADMDYIKRLKLLDEGETVGKFYSEYKKKVAGNFFTDRRIATYWIDERNSEKNEIDFAYYNDINRIDTIYNAGVTFSPYMLITKNDGTTFKVSVNGKKEEVKSFFEDALKKWQEKK